MLCWHVIFSSKPKDDFLTELCCNAILSLVSVLVLLNLTIIFNVLVCLVMGDCHIINICSRDDKGVGVTHKITSSYVASIF